VHHRIPNFVDAEKAAARLAELPEFKTALVVKVNPDTPQKMVSMICFPLYTSSNRLLPSLISVLEPGVCCQQQRTAFRM